MKVADLLIRPYTEADEEQVLECIVASLGGGPAGRRPPEFFRWKHYENPFGRSFILLAESDGRIAGVRAFMRWRFRAGSRDINAVRAVDTATHPDFQGGGIFTKLTLAALDAIRAEGTDLVFNTPNQNSLPGYLKMGWKTVGRVPVWIRIRRPVRFFMKLRSQEDAAAAAPAVDAPTAAEVLDTPGLEGLIASVDADRARLHTVHSIEYLRWRYGRAPLLDYRAVREDGMDGQATGIAVFRVRPRGGLWESTLSELIVRPGDRVTARRLLRRVAQTARVDHIACHFSTGSDARAAARRAGYVRAPGGITFVTNPLGDSIAPDPTSLPSWDLSVGDLEVF